MGTEALSQQMVKDRWHIPARRVVLALGNRELGPEAGVGRNILGKRTRICMQRPRPSLHLSKGRWFHWESVFEKRKGLRLGGDWKESVKVEGRGKWGGG